MTNIGIIVLNWKQPELTIQTIDSFLKIKHNDFSFHIFLVDNFSPDNSFDQLRSYFSNNSQITLLKTPKNLGYTGGNNYGLTIAQEHENYDFFLLANNDIKVDPMFLEKLLKASSNNPDVGILGPKIYFAPGFEYHPCQQKDKGNILWSTGGRIDWNNIIGSNRGIDEIDNGQYDKDSKSLDFISGCCQLIKIDVIKKIGLLDDDYFMYLEDADFCQRAKINGFNLLYVYQSKIWHYNAGSSTVGGSLHDYFLTRNRLLFGYKYASLRVKLAIFRDSINILFVKHFPWQKKGVLDFYFNRLNKGSWK